MEDNLDFQKICRVCLNEGVMMSIFKVNISKKLMACANVQVWQNDNLPAQICQKCSAKLHISFQFKKLCEKSDGKLRQYLNKVSERREEQQSQPLQQIEKEPTTNISSQYTQSIPENSCAYIECNTLIDNVSQNNFIPVSQPEPQQMTQMEYSQLAGYNVDSVGQVQVYNGNYNMPLDHTAVLHNQEIQPIAMDPQAQPQQQVQYIDQTQQQQQQPEQQLATHPTCDIVKEDKTKSKHKPTDVAKQCQICNKVFSTATKLTRHMKTHASDMPYKCKTCNKGFAHSGNFKIHLRMHTGERPFRCVVCDKGCRQAQDLEKHMRTHTGERPHKCLMCPKAFSTRSNLIAHIRIHTGERPYVCCVCQKSFCQSNELTKHMRTHTGEKSHICDICNKGFNGSSTLIVHRRSHTGERPYVCLVCNKAFTQNSCLVTHMKRHNLNSQCDNNFNTKQIEEKETSNTIEEKINCSFCTSNFNTSNEFNEHLKTHHTSTTDGS
ncbi:zinc finger protein 501-like [Diorhabda carinulata]|uniref:zinc finger protein 501-like n=1 Tax=Diorhabda carinulata TaxID=1163345 RepID=UPI0025A229CA|nr:zinc finger protein 501-like [Diorhabda carinulata]